ncbi:hypothetical protein RB653_006083 [Dictyostelium firmibasis]|uniref:HTH La-type RNA-binding domain-containing protein n=1 Tax=Dictyostelium firmibasis TaxID=79012 RepID=A0AAN7UAQ3_9MYCE
MSDIKINDIKKSIEFYFGDSNLRKDKFLFNLVQTNKNDGWIDLSTILEFQKIKSILNDNSLTDEQLDLIFKDNKLLILNQDKNKIKRIEWPIKELTQLEIKEIDEKTIYIEPITNLISTPDLIRKILLKSPLSEQREEGNEIENDELIQHISIPKFSDKTLKGFAFIEFLNKDIANQTIKNIDSNPNEYQNLIALSKFEWLDKKKQFSYLNNPSRYLKISNIPTTIQINFNNNNNNDGVDDELKVINLSGTINQNNNILKMNKPYLWKFFDEQTNISVSYLDYITGSDKAILKFSSQLDIQNAIDQFQLGEIKLYNNILTIIHLSESEINSLKQRTQSHEKSKFETKKNYYNNNNNNNNNKNNNDNKNYNKRKRD